MTYCLHPSNFCVIVLLVVTNDTSYRISILLVLSNTQGPGISPRKHSNPICSFSITLPKLRGCLTKLPHRQVGRLPTRIPGGAFVNTLPNTTLERLVDSSNKVNNSSTNGLLHVSSTFYCYSSKSVVQRLRSSTSMRYQI